MPTNPLIELVNVPVPVPSFVLLSETVGLCEVLQHKPRAVIDSPFSAVMFPPETEDVCVIEVISSCCQSRNCNLAGGKCNLISISRSSCICCIGFYIIFCIWSKLCKITGKNSQVPGFGFFTVCIC